MRTVIVWDAGSGLRVDLSGREGSVVLKLLDTHCSIMDRDIYPSSYHENALKAKKSRKEAEQSRA